MIDIGPYAIVRHPGYFASFLLFVRLRVNVGFVVGIDAGGFCFAVARVANRLGRPDAASGIVGIRSLRTTGSLAVDSRRVVSASDPAWRRRMIYVSHAAKTRSSEAFPFDRLC